MKKIDVMLIDKNNEVWYLCTMSDYSSSNLTCKKAMQRFIKTHRLESNIKSQTTRRIMFNKPINDKSISSRHEIYGITAYIN